VVGAQADHEATAGECRDLIDQKVTTLKVCTCSVGSLSIYLAHQLVPAVSNLMPLI
jgi:hypothetical protein